MTKRRPLVPLAGPPGSGITYLNRLLSACGVSAPACHTPEHVEMRALKAPRGFVVPTRDHECALASIAPDREPAWRQTAWKVVDSYCPGDVDRGRQICYEEVMRRVWLTGVPWRFVSYESLLLHPEHTLASILSWIGVDEEPAWRPEFWLVYGHAPIDGNRRMTGDSWVRSAIMDADADEPLR